MIEFLLGLSPGLLVGSIIIAFIGLISQMSLYAKAGQPALSALVPVWNVIVFCQVVGRPAKHSLFLIIPGLVMVGALAAFWPQIDGLFPIHGQGGELVPGPTTFSEVIVPFSIIGIAAIPMAYFVVIMFIEVCDSFGKHKTIDKVLCVAFNGVYILFALGISDASYEAPWYAKKNKIPYDMPDFKHKGKKIHVDPNAEEGHRETVVDIDPTSNPKKETINKKSRAKVSAKTDPRSKGAIAQAKESMEKSLSESEEPITETKKIVKDVKEKPKRIEKKETIEEKVPVEKEEISGSSKKSSGIKKGTSLSELKEKYKKKSQ